MTIIRPIGDRIIVKRKQDVETMTKGGLHIPEVAKERPQQGTVIAVGEFKVVGGLKEPLAVHVGDVVLFGKYAGAEIKIDGEEHLIMREEDILGIVMEGV
jgi:chaperonin GroES